MKPSICLLALAVLSLVSCNSEKREFTGARFVDNTLNDFYPYIEKAHLNRSSHPLQRDIMELCKQINQLTGEVVIAGGGWNKYGEFADGNQTGIGFERIRTSQFLTTVHDFRRSIKVKYAEDEDLKDILEDLDGNLYLITDYWTEEKLKEYSVIQIAADLTLVQNKLLLTEIKLHERKNCKNNGA